MPTDCSRSDASPYAVKHNPAAYYTEIRDLCQTQDTPGPLTPQPRFVFVTPNMCHDMHDCAVQDGDRWLSTALPEIASTIDYKRGGTAIFITWDEDDRAASNHVPTIVLSPYTRAGVRSSIHFNHYSLLRTTEQLLALPCLASACKAKSMRSAFGL